MQLADSLNKDRNPVREALTGLAADGLFDLRNRAGTMVSPVRPEAVRIARLARDTLERGILQIAVKSSNNQVPFSMGQGHRSAGIGGCAVRHRPLLPCGRQDASGIVQTSRRNVLRFAMSDAETHMDRVHRMNLHDANQSDLLEHHRLAPVAIKPGNVSAACDPMTVHLCTCNGGSRSPRSEAYG